MRLRSKGQLTVPIEVREHLGLHEGDEVKFVIQGDAVQIVRAKASASPGRRVAARLRGRGSSGMSTDEIMNLLRGED
ncbi:AbrB/MazE/SpoVT family DNA-binding domain-containing protein [Streptomyces sp. SID13031]|uniref:AbrB/MazE/SpoVT family DNA-binding domain-containing protein n=1 Tax=Streptomyces sp. SID13031 TaxID=2706046 RepID=UPI0013CBC54D|nr:AbrB/MazE/SpoVT family DNA-binding domain-containing protein [Streptomyces sp. SID13031]